VSDQVEEVHYSRRAARGRRGLLLAADPVIVSSDQREVLEQLIRTYSLLLDQLVVF